MLDHDYSSVVFNEPCSLIVITLAFLKFPEASKPFQTCVRDAIKEVNTTEAHIKGLGGGNFRRLASFSCPLFALLIGWVTLVLL